MEHKDSTSELNSLYQENQRLREELSARESELANEQAKCRVYQRQADSLIGQIAHNKAILELQSPRYVIGTSLYDIIRYPLHSKESIKRINQTGRNHEHPKAFYRDYKGFLVTDGLQQYHLVEKELPGITNANCWAHARRDFADACKAMGTKNQALKTSVAHRALELIGAVYAADDLLKDLNCKERLKQRQITVKPLVETFFAWVREQLERNTVPPKGKTAEGLNYCLNQEKYLRVFLTDGDIPIDNSASERAIRTFCIGKKNWVLHNTTRGARESAIIYSVSETAKANSLKPYEYFKHLLSELPNRADEDGNINPSGLDDLLPSSEDLPDECYKRR